jgi:hypothetical protein
MNSTSQSHSPETITYKLAGKGDPEMHKAIRERIRKPGNKANPELEAAKKKTERDRNSLTRRSGSNTLVMVASEWPGETLTRSRIQ